MKNNVLCILISCLATVALQIHLSNAVQRKSPSSAGIENEPQPLGTGLGPQPISNETTVAPTTVSPNTTLPTTTTVPTTTPNTTIAPNTTTPTPTTTPIPTTTTLTPTTTVPSNTTNSTTVPTTITTAIPTSTNGTMPTSQATTTVKPTAAPSSDRRFDGPSFIGGIVLSFGIMAIGFVAWKFYKARTERNYHTL